ncbi:hypothetical protein, partial [Corynebacterium glyciniphilum]|uniref:hypothetical protein n=1 Tax=Corynebacterium glyciniphilum TaxID=1404244 RepID=UPI0011AB5523
MSPSMGVVGVRVDVGKRVGKGGCGGGVVKGVGGVVEELGGVGMKGVGVLVEVLVDVVEEGFILVEIGG